MNRKQRRDIQRELQKKGLSKAQAKQVVNTYYTGNPLEEGTKVKLDYEGMVRHPDWKRQREDFKEWVTAHKDEVFTVEWDAHRKANDTKDKKLNVCLVEDTTEPKWLFHSTTLIPVPTARVKLNNGKEVAVNNIKSDLSNIDNAVTQALEEAKQRDKDMVDF